MKKVKEGDKRWMNANKLESREREKRTEQFRRYEEIQGSTASRESDIHTHTHKIFIMICNAISHEHELSVKSFESEKKAKHTYTTSK